MGRVIIVGDAHIDCRGGKRHKQFSSFLDFVCAQKPQALFLTGDIFEFLHGKGSWVLKNYPDIFKKLENISKTGTKIFYAYGNHDFNFNLSYAFIKSAPNFDVLDVAGLKIHFGHGDGVDPSDTKYHFLKKVLRSNLFKLTAYVIPDFILYSIANFFSSLSRRADSSPYNLMKRSNSYKEHALNILKQNKLDVVVLGHTHIPEFCQLKDTNQVYVNPGFFGEDLSYATIDDANGVYIGIFNKEC